jgi:hypothetical protein
MGKTKFNNVYSRLSRILHSSCLSDHVYLDFTRVIDGVEAYFFEKFDSYDTI